MGKGSQKAPRRRDEVPLHAMPEPVVDSGDETARPSEEVGDAIEGGVITEVGKMYGKDGRFLCWFVRVK